jgi:hypothetical protein
MKVRGNFHVPATLTRGKETNILSVPGIEPSFVQPSHYADFPLFPLITIHNAENTQLSFSIREQATYFNLHFPGRIKDRLHDRLGDSKFDSQQG